jgi:CHAT domain-containing protein
MAQSLAQLQQQARAIADQRGEIYSIGTLGQIYEQTQQWQIAQSLTKDALIQSQGLNAPELTYLWQWQLARIEEQQGKRELALNSYLGAVETVKSVTQDLAGNPEFRLTFQKNVDRLYRQLISLLLTPNAQNTVSQTDLQLARNQIESLQIEELNNFFRAVCLTKKTETIENIDPDAAIIYPLILPNRLALILSLPQQPLQIFNTAITAPTLETAIAQFRQTIVIRSRRDFYGPAKVLYDALIRPLEATLKAQKQLKTLVFVPDGSLRNIPLAALYDGQQFLLEQYRIAVTPGLQLLNPTSIKRANLRTLFAGITEDNDRPGFIPLAYVNQELKAVQSQVEISPLLNQAFTPEALKEKLTYEASGIVHLATHGRFSSQLQDTFVNTWTQPLNINDLAALLKASNPTGETGLELLVLSACETAVGDQRAALGLAGIAVRSGAKSTMATLWSINDEATAQFMARFYQQLATQKVSKAEALRQAQLALLQNQWYKHPFYWAAYILVGDWL